MKRADIGGGSKLYECCSNGTPTRSGGKPKISEQMHNFHCRFGGTALSRALGVKRK